MNRRVVRRWSGFTLLELLLAMTLGALVLSSLLAFSQQVTLTVRQQLATTELTSASRLAVSALSDAIEGSAGTIEPWLNRDAPAVGASLAGVSEAGDRLTVTRWTPINCLGNRNPVTDAADLPAVWIRTDGYEVREGHGLVRTCHYGPDRDSAIRQLNAATLLQGVEQLVLRFGEDRDGDRRVDAWVRAGEWTHETKVRTVRLSFVVASNAPLGPREPRRFQLFGAPYQAPADGRLRMSFIHTAPIRSRQR